MKRVLFITFAIICVILGSIGIVTPEETLSVYQLFAQTKNMMMLEKKVVSLQKFNFERK